MPAGRPTKYNPDFHPEDCERMGKEGKFKVEMALAWDVDTDTINEWCRVHQKFSDAYKRACNYRAAWMMNAGRNGLYGSKESQFNAVAWSMMMRYDGQNTDERTVSLPEMASCKTFAEMSDCVVKAFAAGKLTPKEANTLADIISKGAKVEEQTVLKEKIELIEKTLKEQGNEIAR